MILWCRNTSHYSLITFSSNLPTAHLSLTNLTLQNRWESKTLFFPPVEHEHASSQAHKLYLLWCLILTLHVYCYMLSSTVNHTHHCTRKYSSASWSVKQHFSLCSLYSAVIQHSAYFSLPQTPSHTAACTSAKPHFSDFCSAQNWGPSLPLAPTTAKKHTFHRP